MSDVVWLKDVLDIVDEVRKECDRTGTGACDTSLRLAATGACDTIRRRLLDHKPCGASTGICGTITFGSGRLDDHGYWEIPCDRCARAYEWRNPEEVAWPPPRAVELT